MAVNPPRAYRSPLRAEQARATRRRVIDSALKLFLDKGFPGTTIAAVARGAGVSPDTIYSTFGTKIALLREVMDTVIGGDDEDVALLERTGPQAMRAEPDQRRQLTMFAEGITEQLERVRPIDDILRSAAAVDPVAAELRADLQERQRRAAMRAVVSWVTAHGPLRDGLSDEEAAAVVWTLTSPEVHRMLRDTWGWTQARFTAWLAETLIAGLVPPS
jgi:AcrR family transcriptional regulator